MESNYFEKIQKRYDELAKEGNDLTAGIKFYQSLLQELPDVPDDTYCTHEYMFRIHESIYKDKSSKTLLYRLYNDETFEWSEWRENDFNTVDGLTRTILDSSPSVYWKDKDDVERVDFMWDVILKDKKIYILNMDGSEESYVPSRQLVLYAQELLQKKYVRKSDKKEIGGDIFPWLFIQVGRPAMRYPNTPVGAEIFSLHTRETKEESRHSFAWMLVDGFPEIYEKRKGSGPSKEAIEKVEASLDKGVLPAEIIHAPVHINYGSALFTPAQGIQQAQERIKVLEEQLNEIYPEFLRLKKILDMSPEDREKFIAEEEKKEAEAEKQKAEEEKRKAEEKRRKREEACKRKEEEAAKKAEEEAEEGKKSKLYWMGIFVWLITLMSLCGITLAIDELFGSEGWMVLAIFIGGIIIVKYAWKAAKKALKRKWGIKDEE